MTNEMLKDPVAARQSAAFVLGIDADADDVTALEAFRDAARRHHPNAGGDMTLYRTVVSAWAVWNATGHVVLTDDDLEASLELTAELPPDASNRPAPERVRAITEERAQVIVEEAVAERRAKVELVDEDGVVDALSLVDVQPEAQQEPEPELPTVHVVYLRTGTRSARPRISAYA